MKPEKVATDMVLPAMLLCGTATDALGNWEDREPMSGRKAILVAARAKMYEAHLAIGEAARLMKLVTG